jgi:uncharacterized RDD family membrane protein YckC
MTMSGGPQGDEAGPRQEGIWEDTPASGLAEGGPAEGGSMPRLTRRLTSTERIPGPGGLLYADLPNRIMALVLDLIVLILVGLVLAWLFGGLVTEAGALDSPGGQLDVVAFLLVMLLETIASAAYFIGLWMFAGATLGMRLLGLRIGDEADGRPLGPRQAVVRWLLIGVPVVLAAAAVFVPNTIGLILGALGGAWLLLLLYTMVQSPTKQGLHDRLAHTILVRARRTA